MSDAEPASVRLIDTGGMPETDSLKRLGGGRWATRDGRLFLACSGVNKVAVAEVR